MNLELGHNFMTLNWGCNFMSHINFDNLNYVQVFDFDRCTGLLSNPVKIDYNQSPDSQNNAFSGIAFSPNSRFLYLTWYWGVYNFQLMQFDTEAADIEASKTIVAECFGSVYPYACAMGKTQLGPDGRIYIAAGYTSKFHVVSRPDMLGDACGFAYEGHEFGVEYPGPSMPYFPSYRLGPMDGSPCDTLGLDNHPVADFHWDATGLGVFFTDESYYAPETWQWDFGDGSMSNEQHPQHIYSSVGEYYVCLVVSNQFSSDTVCQWVTVDSLVGTADYQGTPKNTVGVNPNPADESIAVTLYHPLALPSEWVLYNAVGIEIRSATMPTGQRRVEVGLDNVPAGLYFWSLKGKGGQLGCGKLIVIK